VLNSLMLETSPSRARRFWGSKQLSSKVIRVSRKSPSFFRCLEISEEKTLYIVGLRKKVGSLKRTDGPAFQVFNLFDSSKFHFVQVS
jgi:hypothetical protein